MDNSGQSHLTKLCTSLAAGGSIHVSAVAGSVQEAVSTAQAVCADLLFMNDEQTSDQTLANQLRSLSLKIVLFCQKPTPDVFTKFLLFDAAGLATYDLTVAELQQALPTLGAGTVWFSDSIVAAAQELMNDQTCVITASGNYRTLGQMPMTEEEQRVLKLVTAGLSNAQISERLEMPIEAVRRVIRHILLKLAPGRSRERLPHARENHL